MKRYLRTVTKKKKTKFEHSINIPAKIVRELELSGSIVELKIKDGYFMVKKIGDTLDSSMDDEENKDYTIHY